jgi:hypothetical protein
MTGQKLCLSIRVFLKGGYGPAPMDAAINSEDVTGRSTMDANCSPRRSSLVEAIRTGIERRNFYILPAPDQIPGCYGNKKTKLECARRFASAHGWQVTVHNGNGWLLFTVEQT